MKSDRKKTFRHEPQSSAFRQPQQQPSPPETFGYTSTQGDYQSMADQSFAAESPLQMYQLGQVTYNSATARSVVDYRAQNGQYSSEINVGSLLDSRVNTVMESGGQAFHSEVRLIGNAAQAMGSNSNDQATLFAYYRQNAANRGQATLYTERIPCNGGGGIGGEGCRTSLERALLPTDRVYYSFNGTDELEEELRGPRWEAEHADELEVLREMEAAEAAEAAEVDPYASEAAQEFFGAMDDEELEQWDIDWEKEKAKVNDQFD